MVELRRGVLPQFVREQDVVVGWMRLMGFGDGFAIPLVLLLALEAYRSRGRNVSESLTNDVGHQVKVADFLVHQWSQTNRILEAVPSRSIHLLVPIISASPRLDSVLHLEVELVGRDEA